MTIVLLYLQSTSLQQNISPQAKRRKRICINVFTQQSEVIFSHRRQKLTLLHLFIDLFRKEIFPHSSEHLQG